MSGSEQHRWRVLSAFALVYLFWGSTYLGIGVAVRYVPPYVMTGTRFLIAGLAMLAYCAWSGRRIAATAQQLLRLAVIACLLLTLANTLLAWAEQTLPTGLSALIVAITPLWFLVVDSFLMRGDRVSYRGYLGLLLGIIGIVVLLWPKLLSVNVREHRQIYPAFVLMFGSFCWSVGSALSKRWQKGIDPFSASGWEMALAGAMNLGIAGALGEYPHAHWTPQAIGAVAYLIVFGSWVGFSAYIWLLQHVSMSKVATYAYVNPVVAVILGWFFLHERVDVYLLAGTLVIVSSVALVTGAKVHKRTSSSEPELAAVEAASD
ncbi:MAG TPA: EamA family transporter [Terriglobales bacterium]|nr:EamA family transporter [Terriglobales bacterium]